MTGSLRPAARHAKAICFALAALLYLAFIPTSTRLLAQAGPVAVNDTAGRSSGTGFQSSAYRPPTARERFHQYLFDVYGPPAVAAGLVFGGIDQIRNTPPEWQQGTQGFAKRFGFNFGELAIGETARYAMASALRQDTAFHRCSCAGILPRLGHGLLSATTAHAADGHRVFSVPDLIAPYAGGLAATAAWYPSRFGPKDGFRLGTDSLGIQTAVTIIREFLPSRR